jgi:hypothetical protein
MNAMKRTMLLLAAAGLAAGVSGSALAQGTGMGPVGTACKKEIAKYCAKAGHGAAQTRTCLEQHRKQLSAICRKTLDTTGRGQMR